MKPCLLLLFGMPARRAPGFVGDPLVRSDVLIVLAVWAPAQTAVN